MPDAFLKFQTISADKSGWLNVPLIMVLVLLVSFQQEQKLCADIMTFNSNTASENDSVRDAWLTAIGIGAPRFLVDFEDGFENDQNIAGETGLFPAGLVIDDTGTGTPSVIIRSGNGVIGGSNPVGTYSATHDEQAYLELDFSTSPVDYVAFQDIDHAGTSGIVTFVGGMTAGISIETTATSGNTAEFFGIYRNDMPLITLVQLNASGDGRWGVDTIEYGRSLILLGDVNLDGVVSLLDVQPFVELLAGGDYQAEADINQDGVVNLLDVQLFVDLLAGG